MGFEIGQTNAPSINQVVDDLTQKIDDDITTVSKKTISVSNLGVRDKLRYLFKLPSEFGEEAKIAEQAAASVLSPIRCQNQFGEIK
jgi:hypothetical protein